MPSIWDRIESGVGRLFGVPSGPTGLLGEDDLRAMRRGGLLSFGSHLLSAQGQPFAQAFGGGVQAGREGALQELQVQDALVSRRQAARRREIMQRLGAGADLGEMFRTMLAEGDIEGAKTAAEVLKSMQGSEGFRLEEGINPATGEREFFRAGPQGPPEFLGVPAGPDEVQQQRMFQRSQQLGDDYHRQTQPWLIPYAGMQRAKAYVAEAKRGNSSAQLQMLYSFINTLDNSVVREGEAALFMRAAPYIEQARAWINRIRGEGAVMAPKQVDEIASILDEVTIAFDTRFSAIREHFVGLGNQWGVRPETFMDIPGAFRYPTRGEGKTDVNDIMGRGIPR